VFRYSNGAGAREERSGLVVYSLRRRFSSFGFGVRASRTAGHALALFVVVCIPVILSSGVWMLVTAYEVFGSRQTKLSERIKVRLGLALLSVLLWIVWLGDVT
jgi:purine-cytosine permease-like protein